MLTPEPSQHKSGVSNWTTLGAAPNGCKSARGNKGTREETQVDKRTLHTQKQLHFALIPGYVHPRTSQFHGAGPCNPGENTWPLRRSQLSY